MSAADSSPTAGATPGAATLRALGGLLGSVWLGIVLLVLILLYSSIGSAVPAVRQHWLLEKTELEFFTWWPFTLLIGLLILNMSVVTVRRIPLNAVHAGVWLIHGGIVVLALGSVWYFGTKVEGDTPIFRRRLLIEMPGRAEPLTMLVRPGNRSAAENEQGAYTFEIADIQPEHRLGKGGHEPGQVYAVQVAVQAPDRRFIRRLFDGRPELTADVLPGEGPAGGVLGSPLADPDLRMSLVHDPQTHFYVMDSSALYTRPAGADHWLERPLRGLPHYHERIASREDVWLPAGEALPLRPIDLVVPPADDPRGDPAAADPLGDYEVRITGYLRYAFLREGWVGGGERPYPVCEVTLRVDGRGSRDFALAAFDPQARSAEGGQLVFEWVESEAELEGLMAAPPAVLTIRVPQSGLSLEVPAVPADPGNPESFTPVDGTDYAYRIRNVIENLVLRDRALAVAIVDVRAGERSFTRMVSATTEDTRDLDPDSHEVIETDPGIEMAYRPGVLARITLVGGPQPVGLNALYRGDGGEVTRHRLDIGRPAVVGAGVALTPRALHRHAVRVSRPAVVPRWQRDRDARRQFSMIRVEVSRGNWSESQWLAYNHYALPSEQYELAGRTRYQPVVILLPDGRTVELLYSRERRRLPAAVALESFALQTFQGGLIGATGNVRDYISRLRFAHQDGTWGEPVQMSSNRPASHGGLSFFQSSWDPPGPGSAGLNFTGAGVGSRHGVGVQLAGCCIAVSGMVYAFYVKPIVLLRRRRRGNESPAGTAGDGVADGPPSNPGNGDE